MSTWKERLSELFDLQHGENEGKAMWTLYRGRGRSQQSIIACNNDCTGIGDSKKLLERHIEAQVLANTFFIIFRTSKNDPGTSCLFEVVPDYSNPLNAMIGSVNQPQNNEAITGLMNRIGQLEKDIVVQQYEYKIDELKKQIEETKADQVSFVDRIGELLKNPHIAGIVGQVIQRVLPPPAVPVAVGSASAPVSTLPGNTPDDNTGIDFNLVVTAVDNMADAGFANPDQVLYQISLWAKANPEPASQYFAMMINPPQA